MVKELIEARRKAAQKEKALKKLGDPVLRKWQERLLTETLGEPDDRKITWYNDPIGNTGKTYMSKLLILKHGAVRFENAKTSDIKHAYKGERIVIFDLSRSQQGVLNYEIIAVSYTHLRAHET